MKNCTEMIVSVLLKILINDHSLNASKKAINRLLLTAAPGAEELESFMEWKKEAAAWKPALHRLSNL